MIFLYDLCIRIYGLAIWLFSAISPKAKKWIDGRKNWKVPIKATLKKDEQRIWVHCSSLGEFEQGRTLIERLKNEHPGHKIVLSFFSPSGYEIRKDYPYADHVFYLPLDTKANAEYFVEQVNPSLVVFVKYEFWFHYLHTLHSKKIPVILISAAFRNSQVFFKGYGSFFRKILGFFTLIFVQDEASAKLLQGIIPVDSTIAGDTRYDRVLTIASTLQKIPLIEEFTAEKKVLIAGSTWKEDEQLLQEVISILPKNYTLIIAPHETGAARIKEVKARFADAILFSELQNGKVVNRHAGVLIIDNIGMLSSLYAYGNIAFVGGGFQKGGIHNILEPAVFGVPVIFGPVYKKFVEAKELASLNYCFSVADAAALKNILSRLINDEPYYQSIHQSLKKYMQQKAGATDQILSVIEANNWL